jgi:hypothetical protein
MHDLAQALLDGDGHVTDRDPRCRLLALHCDQHDRRLVEALASSRDVQVRQLVAEKCQLPDILDRLAGDDDATVAYWTVGNSHTPDSAAERVLLRELDCGERPELEWVTTHPRRTERVLEHLPAAVVAAVNPDQLAGPSDPDGTAEIIAMLAGDESMTLADARLLARLTLSQMA